MKTKPTTILNLNLLIICIFDLIDDHSKLEGSNATCINNLIEIYKNNKNNIYFYRNKALLLPFYINRYCLKVNLYPL